MLVSQVGKTQTVIALLVAAMLSMTEDAEIDIYANSAVARMTNARKFVSAMAQILENHPEVRMFFQHVRGTVANDSVIEYKNTR
jgi:Cft2 family RNA processing exonuclease